MNKALPVILIALIAVGGAWFYLKGSNQPTESSPPSPTSVSANEVQGSEVNQGSSNRNVNSIAHDGNTPEDVEDEDEDDLEEEDIPAGDKYKNAQEAMEAIKKGSLIYDDTILQQFVKPGENCTWCDQVYSQLRGLLKDAQQSSEQKSYFGEILAVSGKLDNIRAIVNEVSTTQNPSDKESLAESLELTIGGDDVVKYLSEFAASNDEMLKEAAIAAISNQGSRLSAEVLYKAAVESNNPDGYYSSGIGLGELVPDEEAYSYLQELIMKQDEYSHLGVKALLNAGLPGLKLVVDSMSVSPNAEKDKDLLKDAVDHVGYDDETKEYITKLISTTKSPTLQQFGQEILNEFNLIEEEEKD